MTPALQFMSEKDPQKKEELAQLLRIYAKHNVDLTQQGGAMGTDHMEGKIAEAKKVNSAQKVIDQAQDSDLSTIFPKASTSPELVPTPPE